MVTLYDYNAYQRQAIRTAKRHDTRKEELTYYALGLVGEATEAAASYSQNGMGPKTRSELGDTAWYIARVADLCSIKLNDIAGAGPAGSRLSPYGQFYDLMTSAGKVGEVLKKVVRDDKAIDRSVMLSRLQELWGAWEDLAGKDVEAILERNIRKLEQRYPDNRFTVEHAVARKDGEKDNEA